MSDGKCYVGVCSCGAIRAASVIGDPSHPIDRKDTAKFLSDIVKAGFAVETWTVEQVRAGDWRCRKSGTETCDTKKKKRPTEQLEMAGFPSTGNRP